MVFLICTVDASHCCLLINVTRGCSESVAALGPHQVIKANTHTKDWGRYYLIWKSAHFHLLDSSRQFHQQFWCLGAAARRPAVQRFETQTWKRCAADFAQLWYFFFSTPLSVIQVIPSPPHRKVRATSRLNSGHLLRAVAVQPQVEEREWKNAHKHNTRAFCDTCHILRNQPQPLLALWRATGARFLEFKD